MIIFHWNPSREGLFQQQQIAVRSHSPDDQGHISFLELQHPQLACSVFKENMNKLQMHSKEISLHLIKNNNSM
jgi:hypothetical protein